MTTMLPEAPVHRTAPPRGRRWRLATLLTAGVVVAVALLTLWVTGSGGSGELADPESPARHGSKALAQVLRQQGVEVDVVRSIGALESTPLRRTTTVVVSSMEYLGEAAARRLANHASSAGRLVLVEPGDLTLTDLEIPLQVTGAGRLSSAAGCTNTVADPGDRIEAPGSLYQRAGADAGAHAPALPGESECFVDEEGGGAAVIVLPGGIDLPETVVLGSAGSMTNSLIGTASHAALSLRALGAAPHLVWYVASVSDLDVPDPSGQRLRGSDRGVPAWFGPGVLLVGIAFVAYALARGRRLGRIVAEPLPVIVRAVETTEARGRLYRRAADRGRAAQSLRTGTRSRVAARLGVPRDASTQSLAHVVAQAIERDPAEVTNLLDGPTPDTDSALVLLADQLAHLEENVRRA